MTSLAIDDLELARLRSELAGKTPYDVIHTALAAYGDDLRIASSFGAEDMILLHEAARAGKDLGVVPRIFLLDTGRLHQETYDLVERARNRYKLPIEVFAPDTVAVEELVRTRGPNSFYTSIEERKHCCQVRKLGPLSRALAGARAWITGLRRAQSPTRADVEVVCRDDTQGGILKLNPLAAFEDADVWSFIDANRVPVHALHAQGFPSIGCAPCTRAIAPGEDIRAGRWWWESPEHKECGLHPRRRSA